MEHSILFMILLQILLILLNAVFACAEIAVISVSDTKLSRMASEGDKRALQLVRLTKQPARFLATIQVAITLSGFLGSAFAAENFSDLLTGWLTGLGVPLSAKFLDTASVIVITIVLSYFTLVFGELVPKQIAMRKAFPLALRIGGLLNAIAKLFAPLVSLLTLSANTVLRLLGIDPDAVEEEVGEEDIRMMVDAGNERGTIDSDERDFIRNVFEFDDLTAQEIATHRTDVVMLSLNSSMEEWDEIISRTRYTCYPVCKDCADQITGILNTKEYFRLEQKDRETTLEKAVHPAYFVPERIKADTLFGSLKKEKCTLAILLDEYGGMSGLVTLHDLVEQLVGELYDENEPEDASPVEKLSEHVWAIRGTALLKDVENVLHIPLSCEDYDTFNGFLFHTLGTIPKDGTGQELTIDGFHITITEVQNHQVIRAIVKESAPLS